MVLTALILIPALGGALSWAVSRNRAAARGVALLACGMEFALALSLWFGPSPISLEQRVPWIPQFGISYHLALDGLSLLLIVLTGLLGMVAVLASWREIDTRVGAYYCALLGVLTGVVGVFLARDLLLFYLFWELMLVPMYFLIGVWGHEHRLQAAVKFFLFTFLGSLLMLGAILGLAFARQRLTGVLTFDAQELLATPLSPAQARWLMLGFFLGFAVKLPVVPLHTWLADAHTEAPTGGSVVLAGLLLKTGAYGMLRFALPLFPQVTAEFAPVACGLGVAGIVYGALLAYGQEDLKRLIAFSSVSHMGFVLLGIYAGNELALQGAVMQMVCHGLGTGALFALAGSIQARCETRALPRLGGLWETAPKLGGFVLFFALASLGLHGLGNFLAEFLVLTGAFVYHWPWAVLGALGLVLSLVYSLRLVQDAVHGPNRAAWHVADLSGRELVMLGVLAALLLGLGLYPRPVLALSQASLRRVERADPAPARVTVDRGRP